MKCVIINRFERMCIVRNKVDSELESCLKCRYYFISNSVEDFNSIIPDIEQFFSVVLGKDNFSITQSGGPKERLTIEILAKNVPDFASVKKNLI